MLLVYLNKNFILYQMFCCRCAVKVLLPFKVGSCQVQGMTKSSVPHMQVP